MHKDILPVYYFFVSEDNNEENLVVEELVNIIRNKQQKLDNLNDEYEAEDENYNAEKVKADPSFTYQSPKVITGNDVPENEKTPFAVPPSDYRFYEKRNEFVIYFIKIY